MISMILTDTIDTIDSTDPIPHAQPLSQSVTIAYLPINVPRYRYRRRQTDILASLVQQP